MTIVQDLSYNRTAVRQAQRQLNQLGERLLVDGDLGTKTAGAIGRFQVGHGMSPTGRLDSVTSALIDLATLTGGGGGALSGGCQGGCQGTFANSVTPARPGFGPAEGRWGFSPAEGRRDLGMNPTPAQASGRYDFVYDVPVQGPTDEGMRAASCWWAKNRTPQSAPCDSPCVDCTGPIPGWTRQNLYFGPRPSGGGYYTNAGGGPVAPSGIGDLGEAVSFGGRAAYGFSLGQAAQAPATPALNPSLETAADNLISAMTGAATPCTYLANLAAVFQQAWNAEGYTPTLPTSGVYDQATANAVSKLLADARISKAADPPCTPAPAPAPAAPAAAAVVPSVTEPKHGLSTGAMVGIAAAGAVTVGGIIYVATRGSGGSQRRRTKRRR